MLKRSGFVHDCSARARVRPARARCHSTGWTGVPTPPPLHSPGWELKTVPFARRKCALGRLRTLAALGAAGEPEPAATPEASVGDVPAPTPAPAAAPVDVPAVAPAAAAAPASSPAGHEDAPKEAPPQQQQQHQHQHQQHLKMDRLRVSLLAALSSLDRGLAANSREAAEVDQLCSRLEALGGPVALAPLGGGGAAAAATAPAASTSSSGDVTTAAGAAADLLAGTWRLVYSSGFNSGSLGGRRPGPPAALFPTVLGQVYQRIDPVTAKLDNIVELLFSYGPPDLGLLGLGEEALGRGLTGLTKQLGVELKPEQLPAPLRGVLKISEPGSRKPANKAPRRRESPAARLTLRHDYEVTSPATVKIVYEETYGELVGSEIFAQLPRLEAPTLPEPLRPPKFLRSATFEVTFLDASLRITRGDRRELRVYLRDNDSEATVGGLPGAAAAAALDYDD